jgi:hypothetical protein
MNTSEVLQYLAQHLSIDENFTVRLPESEDFVAPMAIVQRLQASDRHLQAGFLKDHLQTFLHYKYFSGHQEPESIPDFANNSAGSLHSKFYQELERANPSAGYYDWHWTIEGLLADGWFAVVKEGLHLQMPATHLQPPEARKVGDMVGIAMPKNLLTVDRYVAVGNWGRAQDAPITNIYFHSSATTALPLLTHLAIGLNQAALPFELTLLIDEADYYRRDSVILRLDRNSYSLAQGILQSTYRDLELGSKLSSPFPIGTKPLAPGVTVAESIDIGQDFGQYFWGAVAQGLATAWQDDLGQPQQRWAAILESLDRFEIDLTCSYLVGPADIYNSWVDFNKQNT